MLMPRVNLPNVTQSSHLIFMSGASCATFYGRNDRSLEIGGFRSYLSQLSGVCCIWEGVSKPINYKICEFHILSGKIQLNFQIHLSNNNLLKLFITKASYEILFAHLPATA